MTDRPEPSRQAVVVGSGPNGLAAAITLANAGHPVTLYEANDTIGGGCRSAELTLPGFTHDVCSAIHPLAVASPFFKSVPMEELGVEWVHPPLALAHPFEDGSAGVLSRSMEETAASVGEDGAAWTDLFGPLVADAGMLAAPLLGPLRIPKHPIAMARFGLSGLQPATTLVRRRFSGKRARGLFAGMAAHAILDLTTPATAAFGLVLGMYGHAVGWPVPKGGSQRIADALAEHLRNLGGEIVTGTRVTSLDIAEDAGAVLFDTTPRQLVDIAGEAIPGWYRRLLGRYRRGPGVFKLDWALDGPVPWTAADCHRAGTVHLGPTLEEIAASEEAATQGRIADRPFVILAQQSLFDPTRAPDGAHTLWGYCHVPNGTTEDMTERIEAQIERFAPGFRDRVIARTATSPAELQAENANYIGGDINGGKQDIRQLFTRPVPWLNPYRTPNRRLYFCSSSTPPGGGVHGMGGLHGARAALANAW